MNMIITIIINMYMIIDYEHMRYNGYNNELINKNITFLK